MWNSQQVSGQIEVGSLSEKFSIVARLKSFSFALQGFVPLIRDQHNARVHLLASVGVVAAAWYFEVTRTDWALIILAMALVWATEAMNTAVEALADALMPEQHPLIKLAKDVAAAGVLIAAIASVLIALLVFAEPLLNTLL
jgi:diacylglycerol kinase